MPEYLVTYTETYTVIAEDEEEAAAVADDLIALGRPSETFDVQVEIVRPDAAVNTADSTFNPFVDIAELLNGRKGEKGA